MIENQQKDKLQRMLDLNYKRNNLIEQYVHSKGIDSKYVLGYHFGQENLWTSTCMVKPVINKKNGK